MNRSRIRQTPSQRGVDLNIDELIIRSVAPGDRQRILREVQEELARLLKENRLPSPHSVPGRQLPLPPPGSRESGGGFLSHQIARGIYHSLSADQ